MRKLLLATTALTCLAASSFAEMSAKLHGKYEFQAGSRHQKSGYNTAYGNLTSNQKNNMFNTNARVGVLLESKTEHGMKYGANIMLIPRTSDSSSYSSNQEKSFLFLEHNFGRVELGSNFDVGTMMNLSASSIAAATGGAADGSWSSYLKSNNLPVTSPTVASAANMSAITSGVSYMYRYGSDNNESMKKISYMTPVYNGFQGGLSYTPDATNTGNPNPTPVTSFTNLKNVVNLALVYQKQVAGVDYGLSLGYDFGGVKDANPQEHKLKDYNVGAKIGKGPFAVAASYGDAGKSLKTKTPGLPKAKQNYYTVGVSYSMDKLSASLTHFGSKNSETKGTPLVANGVTKVAAYSLGMDYMVAAGLKTYAEVTVASISNPVIQAAQKLPKNNGTVIIAGAVVKF